MRRAGKDAPEPCKSTAYAGDPAIKPNASARAATFANFEILNLFPLFRLFELQEKLKVLT
jgi:hypothetical protein